MADKQTIMEDTITLETLWIIFSEIKRTSYGSNIEIRSGFVADTEALYNCFQKELNAQAQISMN